VIIIIFLQLNNVIIIIIARSIGKRCFEERREQCFIEGSAFRIDGSHRKGTT